MLKVMETLVVQVGLIILEHGKYLYPLASADPLLVYVQPLSKRFQGDGGLLCELNC
jgi:hypothetical protein